MAELLFRPDYCIVQLQSLQRCVVLADIRDKSDILYHIWRRRYFILSVSAAQSKLANPLRVDEIEGHVPQLQSLDGPHFRYVVPMCDHGILIESGDIEAANMTEIAGVQ